MLLNTKLLPIVIAGLMNGSFVIPSKYVKNFTNEKIWFYHSIIGLALIPWILLGFISPQMFHNYLLLPTGILVFIIFSGAIFGLGQVFFAYAIETIGVALSFTINLGIGVVIGSMFVVFLKDAFFTTRGFLVTLAVLFILASLIIHYYAGRKSDYHLENRQTNYHKGWLLACLTGITSGLQNITFIIVAFHAATQFQASNSFWVWPPFLLIAAIPMIIGFSYSRKTQSNNPPYIGWQAKIKNLILISLMGLFFTGSLALYSSGMNQLTHQQQILGWPALIVSIILASQLWGWFYKETNDKTKKSKGYRLFSLALLITAIIILAIEA